MAKSPGTLTWNFCASPTDRRPHTRRRGFSLHRLERATDIQPSARLRHADPQRTKSDPSRRHYRRHRAAHDPKGNRDSQAVKSEACRGLKYECSIENGEYRAFRWLPCVSR
jgi:hypothetical protein